MSTRLRVPTHVFHVWDSLESMAGVERVILQIASASDFRHTVLTWQSGDAARLIVASGAEVRVLRRRDVVRAAHEIGSEIGRRAPEGAVLHAHGHWAGLRAAMSSRWLRVPMLWTVHADPSKELTTRWHRMRARLIGRLSARLSTVNHDSARSLQSLLAAGFGAGLAVRVIHNGVSLDLLAGFNRSFSAPALYDFAVVSRLSWEKNVGLVVHAISSLQRRGVRARCVVVGDGPDRAELEALASREGVADLVTFVGWSPTPAQVLTSAKVLVYTSRFGAIGLSALEAMSMGLVAVLPDQGGVRDALVPDSEVILYDASDISSLAGAMEAALDERVGGPVSVAGRLAVRERFSVHATVSAYVEEYRATALAS